MSYYRTPVRQRIRPQGGRQSGCLNPRLLMALGLAAFALISYFGSAQLNPVTGETQYVSLSREQEVALGLQAAPEVSAQYGGPDRSQDVQAFLDAVGIRLVDSGIARGSYPFEFTLLADAQTVNAFALPGGPVFMTAALYDRLTTEDQVAAVLAHEIVHVIGRHGAEQMAQMELTQGLTGAVVLATYDPENPTSQQAAYIAQMVGQLVNMKFGRADEIESDRVGVCLMLSAGYDPNAMVEVMEILAAASGGARPPEFLSTHPDPGNRIQQIQDAISNPSYCP
ncbi:MAG: M48 family peptidase [Anaerolineae bacterium]|nr:MAG: M48 family peptidase [Anaerolineae bacterium]